MSLLITPAADMHEQKLRALYARIIADLRRGDFAPETAAQPRGPKPPSF